MPGLLSEVRRSVAAQAGAGCLHKPNAPAVRRILLSFRLFWRDRLRLCCLNVTSADEFSIYRLYVLPHENAPFTIHLLCMARNCHSARLG